MADHDDFYVYLYNDVDGTPVYVGKSFGDRAWSHLRPSGKGTSNDRLQKLINKRGEAGFVLEPQITARGSEDNMLLVEVALIQHFGRADLALGPLFNQTDGGDGVSNPSDEVGQKQSEAAFRRYGGERSFTFLKQSTGEEFTGKCPQFAAHLSMKVNNVNRLVMEGTDLHSMDGWTVKNSDIVANEYKTKFDFIHLITKEGFTGTQAELVRHTGMAGGVISMMMCGAQPHALGWCLKNKDHLASNLKQSTAGDRYEPIKPLRSRMQTPKPLVGLGRRIKIIVFKQKVLLILLVAALLVGGYYLVSPFQNCMRAIKPVDYSFKPVTTWEAAPSKGGILHQRDQFGVLHSFKVSGYTPTVTEKQRINDYFADLIKDKSSESQLKSGRLRCNKSTKW